MSKADQQNMENFGKSLGLPSGVGGGNGNTSHPGETAVFAFTVDENAAQFQMKFNKGMLKNLGPMATTDVPNLGDEAFDMAGAMLLVRKGDKLVRIMYMQCPCGLDEILPLARTLVSAL
jgi:hypothetical protein